MGCFPAWDRTRTDRQSRVQARWNYRPPGKRRRSQEALKSRDKLLAVEHPIKAIPIFAAENFYFNHVRRLWLTSLLRFGIAPARRSGQDTNAVSVLTTGVYGLPERRNVADLMAGQIPYFDQFMAHDA